MSAPKELKCKHFHHEAKPFPKTYTMVHKPTNWGILCPNGGGTKEWHWQKGATQEYIRQDIHDQALSERDKQLEASDIALGVMNARLNAKDAAKDVRIAKLEKRDSEAATYVESQIAMFARFTGEPPYVGWEGLGLALKEELEAKDKRIAELEKKIVQFEKLCGVECEEYTLTTRQSAEEINAKIAQLKAALNEAADSLERCDTEYYRPDLSVEAANYRAIANGE